MHVDEHDEQTGDRADAGGEPQRSVAASRDVSGQPADQERCHDTNAEHTYFTDQDMPNPWSKLSQYWPQ